MSVIFSTTREETRKEKNFSRFVYPVHPVHPVQENKFRISRDNFIIRERIGGEYVPGEKKNTRFTRYRYGGIVNLSLDVLGFLWELKNTHPFDFLAYVRGGSPA